MVKKKKKKQYLGYATISHFFNQQWNCNEIIVQVMFQGNNYVALESRSLWEVND